MEVYGSGIAYNGFGFMMVVEDKTNEELMNKSNAEFYLWGKLTAYNRGFAQYVFSWLF